MRLELYIHGNPEGFDYIGPSVEKDSFFQRFYNKNKSVEKVFFIENGSQQCYYTYLLSKNVYDKTGRPNAYFGITIRLDSYYYNALHFFSLLDTLCNKWVLGKILKVEESKIQYLTSKISPDIFDYIQKELVDWLKQADENQFSAVPKVQRGSNKMVSLNLLDCSIEYVNRCFKEYGIVSISREYQSIRDKEYEKNILTANQQWTSQLNELQAKYDEENKKTKELEKSVSSLQGQLSLAKSDLEKKSEEIKKRLEELENLKSEKELKEKVIKGLLQEKESLMKLADYIDSLIPQNQMAEDPDKSSGDKKSDKPKDKKGKKKYLYYLGAIVGIILLGLELYLSIDDSIKYNNQIPVNTFNNTTNLRIDVKNFKGEMKKDSIYEFSIYSDKTKVDTLKGNWDLGSYFSIEEGTKKTTTIKLKPICTGDSILIQFKLDNGNKIKRTFKISM